MQGDRVKDRALCRIHRYERAGRRIHVTGTQVVESGVGVELLAEIEIIVYGHSGLCEQVPESIVCVGVGDSAGLIAYLLSHCQGSSAYSNDCSLISV